MPSPSTPSSAQPSPAAPLTFTVQTRIDEVTYNSPTPYMNGWEPALELGLQSPFGGLVSFRGKVGFATVPAPLMPDADPSSWQDAVVEVTVRVMTKQTRVVPWKPDEVPLGAQVRCAVVGTRWVLTCVGSERVFSGDTQFGLADLAARFEHSTDGGRTWHPAGRVEVVHV